MKVDDQPFRRDKEIRIAAKQRFDLRKVCPQDDILPVFAVQRRIMCGVICINDIAQYDAFAVRQLYCSFLFDLGKIDAVKHCFDTLPVKRLVQIVAGIYLVALAGKLIACGAECDTYIAVRFAYFPCHIHAGELVHENIQHDQLKSVRLPSSQKILSAFEICKLGRRTEQFTEICLQTFIHPYVIVNDCDPQNQNSSLCYTVGYY